MRLKHYSLRAKCSDCDWIARFIHFDGKRPPSDMAEAEVTAFDSFVTTHSVSRPARLCHSYLRCSMLTHLAGEENVAASMQND